MILVMTDGSSAAMTDENGDVIVAKERAGCLSLWRPAEWQQRLASANIAESEADANVISMSNRIRDLKKSLGQAS